MEVKKIDIFFCIIICALVITGCYVKRDEKLVTKPIETYKVYDVKSMQKKLVVDGEEIGFPFDIDDLPEKYTMDFSNNFNRESLEGETEYSVFLGSGAYSIETIWKCKKNENIVDDGKVCYVAYDKEQESTNKIFSVDGIGCENTIEEAINKFGEPSLIEEVGELDYISAEEVTNESGELSEIKETGELNYISIVYKQDDDTSITFISLDGENIEQIYMTCGLE